MLVQELGPYLESSEQPRNAEEAKNAAKTKVLRMNGAEQLSRYRSKAQNRTYGITQHAPQSRDQAAKIHSAAKTKRGNIISTIAQVAQAKG